MACSPTASDKGGANLNLREITCWRDLIRFHGVLAPNAKLRREIIQAITLTRRVRMSWARLLKRVFDIEHCPNCGVVLKIIARH